MPDQTALLSWRDGIPVAQAFDDPYFSLQGGLEETRHVFLAGNGLPARFRPGFSILELGFGTGLNFLVTLRPTATRAPRSSPLHEHRSVPLVAARPRPRAGRLSRARAGAAELRPPSPPRPVVLRPRDPRDPRRRRARDPPAWDGQADAAFLDGFAPAKNPEMWEAALLRTIARTLAPGGTLATYSAAGHVRRALADAGLAVDRRRGFGTKRHMTVARKPA
jgi:tRNA U34 5-methylaminomethyl-2-thiouridine-forming methyltransferase MnmC